MQPRRRFRFIKELSEGAFGKVYLAEMITGDNFKSVVAIKLLHGKWTNHQEIVQRSRDEARVLGLLHHRNIIRVEDLTSIQGQCAIVMEYLDGVDLKSLVNDTRDRDSGIPLKVVFEVGSQIASALDAAYNKQPLQGGEPLRLIHRDIKPSNVMLTVAGDVKVLDYGTAQARFDDREAHTQALAFGSAAYMAPERLLGDPDAPSGDIFSLGITLYELLALDAFGKIHIREERYEAKLEKRLAAIDLTHLELERAEQVRMTMRLMLAYDSEQRPSSGEVTELLEALAEEFHDGSIRRFCREVVRPIRENMRPEQDPNDPYTGTTVAEDRSGFTERMQADDDDLDVTGSAEVDPGAVSGAHEVDPSASAPSEKLGAPPPLTAPAQAAPAQAAPAHAVPPPPPAGVNTAAPAGTGIEVAPVVVDPGGTGSGPAAPRSPVAMPDLFTAPTMQISGAGAVTADLLGSSSASLAQSKPVASTGPALRPSQLPQRGDVPDPTASGPVGQAAPARGPVASPSGAAPAPVAAASPVAAARRPPVARPPVGRAAAQSKPASRPMPRSKPLPPPPSGGSGAVRVVGAVLVIAFVLGGGAGVGFANGWFDADTSDVTPGAGPGTSELDGRSGGRVDVGPNEPGRGTVVLRVRPPGQSVVDIKANPGDFKETWNSNGALELVGLPAGRYKTKVSPGSGGSSTRATFVVKDGESCELTFDVSGGGGDWEVGDCTAAQ
jgi:serine/threonine protein kinase